MVYHTWKKLDSFPIAFAVVFSVGIILPFIIALNNEHVTPYVPYISEGGGKLPEAGLFSTFISASTFISQCILLLRYLIVEALNSKSGNELNGFLNKISLVLGCISNLAMIILASYPASTISEVHNSAAGATCVCFAIYLICQTWISFRLLGRTNISKIRLVLTICCTFALLIITTFGVLGSSLWTASYWAGSKTPEDKGFTFYVISASAEWIMVILLILYFTTYISEFKKSVLQFQLELDGNAQNKSSLSNLDIRHP